MEHYVIFSHNSNRAKALDQFTDVSEISIAGMPAVVNEWTFGDINLTYDPCVCNFNSKIEVQPKSYSTGNIFLEGRMIGTSVPLDNSGNPPLLNGTDFLTAIRTAYENDEFIVNGGVKTYNNINKLVEKYQLPPEKAFAIWFLKASSKLSFLIPKAKFGKTKMIEAAGFISNLPPGEAAEGSTLWQQVSSSKFELPLDKVLSSGFDFLVKKMDKVPGISFIEAEIQMQGQLTQYQNHNGINNFEFLTPGSKDNHLPSVTWTDYPLYNEATGLFALLETPEVEYVINQNKFENLLSTNLSQIYIALKNPTKYALNPAAEINTENTEIHAAIEFDLYHNSSVFPCVLENSPTTTCQFDLKDGLLVLSTDNVGNNKVTMISLQQPPPTPFYNAQLMFLDQHPHGHIETKLFLEDNFTITNISENKVTLQTPTLPIDKLSEYLFKVESAFISFHQPSNDFPLNMRLKIMADYQFLPNNYNEVNTSYQFYTYEVNATDVNNFITPTFSCETSNSVMCQKTNYKNIKLKYNEDFNFFGSINFPNDTTIYANNVTISGNISSSNGAVVNIYAANEINVINGSILPEVNLEIKDIFEHESLNPVSDLFVKNFCNSNTYKANQPSAKVFIAQENTDNNTISEPTKPTLHANYKLYPNPTQGKLRFDLATDFEARVSVAIYDLSGREVRKFALNENWQKGKHQKEYDISNLSDGVYLFKFCINENCFNEKVVKAE